MIDATRTVTKYDEAALLCFQYTIKGDYWVNFKVFSCGLTTWAADPAEIGLHIRDDTPEFEGTLKWDGCMEMQGFHICCPEGLKAISKIYEDCREFFGNPTY